MLRGEKSPLSMNLNIQHTTLILVKAVAALLVSVVRLVLADLHSGAEAVRTEVEAAVSALDPDQTGLVDIITATNTQDLLSEVERHPPHLPPLVISN